MEINFYYSNQVEELYESFIEKEFQLGCSPFTKRLVIVPSPMMKGWIQKRMAKEPRLQISMGLQIVSLDQGIALLQQERKLPSLEELFLSCLCQDLQQGKKEERCWKLSQLFLSYRLIAPDLLRLMEEGKKEGKQADLWRKIVHQFGFEKTSAPDPKPKLPKIFLFAMSFLSKEQCQFFVKCASFQNVDAYLLSPCTAFWSDLLSEKETFGLLQKLRNQGAKESQLQTLELYLRDCHPLLANFGRMGREMALYVEASSKPPKERYVIAQEAAEHEDYQDMLFPQLKINPGSLTLLQALQTDLLLLRTPDADKKICLSREDRSIQIHQAATLLREVEVVFDFLADLFVKDPTLQPEDVLVMAPEIALYTPLIPAVFQGGDALIPYQITDLSLKATSVFFQGVFLLFELAEGRFEAKTIKKLFSLSSFSKRHKMTSQDLKTLEEWMCESGIFWGWNAQERGQFLQRQGWDCQEITSFFQGTFEQGTKRLLMGMATDPTDEDPFPLPIVDLKERALFGRWLKILHQLRKKLCIPKESTLEEWAFFLRDLVNTFFAPEEGDEEAWELFEGHLVQLSQLGKRFEGQRFSFESLKFLLEKVLSKERGRLQQNLSNRVTFCSLLPMRAVPAKVIILMGMQEGAFPRKTVRCQDNLLHQQEGVFVPSQLDFDRMLFLEVLLSARQYLAFTYVQQGGQNSLSLLVSELLFHLDTSFSLEGTLPSQWIQKAHPFHRFDQRGFLKDSPFPCYLKRAREQALAFYSLKEPKESFFSPFIFLKKEEVAPQDLTIDLKDLEAFSKNPVKIYFNQTLGIRLGEFRQSKRRFKEPFLPEKFQMANWIKQALYHPAKEILFKADQKGELPCGMFKPFVYQSVFEQARLMCQNVQKAGFDLKEVKRVELKRECLAPKKIEGGWQVPALTFKLFETCPVYVVGEITETTEQGMMVHSSDHFTEIVKIWPKLLAFSLVSKQFLQEVGQEIVFSKTGVVKTVNWGDSQETFQEFLIYYLNRKEYLSPLIPEWTYTFLVNPQEVEKNIKEALSPSSFRPFYNKYAIKAFERRPQEFCPVWKNHWHHLAQKLYQELHEKWFS